MPTKSQKLINNTLIGLIVATLARGAITACLDYASRQVALDGKQTEIALQAAETNSMPEHYKPIFIEVGGAIYSGISIRAVQIQDLDVESLYVDGKTKPARCAVTDRFSVAQVDVAPDGKPMYAPSNTGEFKQIRICVPL